MKCEMGKRAKEEVFLGWTNRLGGRVGGRRVFYVCFLFLFWLFTQVRNLLMCVFENVIFPLSLTIVFTQRTAENECFKIIVQNRTRRDGFCVKGVTGDGV